MTPPPPRAKPVVLVTEPVQAEPLAWLRERTDLIECELDAPGWDDALARAEGMVIRTYTPIDDALLAKAPKLKVIGRAGVGLEHVDLKACAARGVRVVHTPYANRVAVAEYVIAVALDAFRPRLFLDEPIDEKTWGPLRTDELLAERELSELTLGIYGLGRVGSAVAARASAIFGHVLYHDVRTIPENERLDAEPRSREGLLAESDVVTMHVDGRSSNRSLISAEALSHLKPNATLINASRGNVVDHDALAAWLIAHPHARAILDVHDPEPVTETNPVLGLANAHLTPHIAASTKKAKSAMSWVVKDVLRVLQGEEPEFEGLPTWIDEGGAT